jgi:hypothetical protein
MATMAIVPVADYTKVVKQTSAPHLLHTLWGPWSLSYVEYGNGQSESSFKFYPVGLVVGLINVMVAETANKHHRETLEANQIYGKTIEPGATAYGIVILPASTYEPLTFELME